uniref:Uncharacterized protein n=1 Tax=Meloidogyne incognita TaxID=6306 RepID=A0A914M300_MELIC
MHKFIYLRIVNKILTHPLIKVSIYYATKYYNIIGKIGAVIGSYIPWLEAMCLANGASKIVTIDYQPIKIGHENIIYLNAFDFVKRRNS